MAAITSKPFLDHASTIASYYGFRPLRDVDAALFKQEVGRSSPTFHNAALVNARSSVSTKEPQLSFWAAPTPSYPPHDIPARDAGEFCLHIAAVPHSIGEIIIIKTAAAIMSEWQGTPVSVRVNVFGDRDSRERFSRELSAFVRRRFNSADDSSLKEEERARLLAEPHTLYFSRSACTREAFADAPRPMHFLSERSRTHFKELLDHLEQVNLPYELDDMLGPDEREPRVVFRIDAQEGEKTVLCTSGGRYDDFVAKLAGRREGASVHASIYFLKKSVGRVAPFPTPSAQPKMYFVQLGSRAKLRGLNVIDALRRAQIPIAQTFDASHLSPQLSAAHNAGVSHVLIMGEREALDGTVIVRRVRNSSQQIVEVSELPKFLRTLRV